MRYASSLLYGGMLVDAQGATYQDYSRLLLQCPFCKEPVFLSAAAKRPEHQRLTPKSKKIVTIKECEIPCHFVHFSKVAEKCELKSKQIKQADINKSITKGKNQRLRFFQQRFWQIISESNEKSLSLKDCIKKANESLPEETTNDMCTELTEDIVSEFKRLAGFTKEHARELLTRAIADPKVVLSQTQEEATLAASWLSTLELDLHLQIVNEAADFLRTKSADKILHDFVDVANAYALFVMGEDKILKLMSAAKPYRKLKQDYKTLIGNTICSMIAILAGTQWAIAMQEYDS
ncbi:MAG: hypothetical protein RMY28_009380 [Nostoc sp. ChiSLP01]|nr:hypothetical protein [Nostoc sp. CmiSLP01]MDZ8285234.1 hypothetical protein [Nostoc sp. ChiSLP01]